MLSKLLPAGTPALTISVFITFVLSTQTFHITALEMKAAQEITRSTALLAPLSISPLLLSPSPALSAPPVAPDLKFTTAPSGLQWADAKVGSGQPLKPGSPVAIDYVMSTTGARCGSKIYSSKDSSAPYRWVGDGSTIAGLEQAIVGDDTVPPMQPGGIQRVIMPASLGYERLAKPLVECKLKTVKSEREVLVRSRQLERGLQENTFNVSRTLTAMLIVPISQILSWISSFTQSERRR